MSACGHYRCERCDGFVDARTRVVVRSPDAVIASARMSNLRTGYEYLFREGGSGAAQLDGFARKIGQKTEPFYFVLGKFGLGLKSVYKKEYARVKDRQTYVDVWYVTGAGLANELSGSCVSNIVKLCTVKHEVGDCFLLVVPSVQELECHEHFRTLLGTPGVFIIHNPVVESRVVKGAPRLTLVGNAPWMVALDESRMG